MKPLLGIALVCVGIALGQPHNCDSLEACQKAIEAHPNGTLGAAFAQPDNCNSLEECQKAVEAHPKSTLAHFRLGLILFTQQELRFAAEQLREALTGDLEPKWIEVWVHIYLGRIYDLHDERDRAVTEYGFALRTNDDNKGGARDAAAEGIRSPYRQP